MDKKIIVKELQSDLWPDIEQFFTCGGDSGCWCMNHRVKPQDEVTGESAKKMLSEYIEKGKAGGLLAYIGEEPVGWCAIDRLVDLPGHDCTSSPQDENSWAIHCVCVRSGVENQEIEEVMVSEGLKLLAKYNAKVVEAYPEPDSKPGTFATWNTFSGSVVLFSKFGFSQAQRVNEFYTIMRKELSS